MMKAYRIVAKIKNNRLHEAIAERFPGMRVNRVAALVGVQESLLYSYINMREWPWNKRRGEWTANALRLASALEREPEYLFDPALYGRPPFPVVEVTCDGPELLDVLHMSRRLELPDEAVRAKEALAALGAAIDDLKPREREVLARRFGLESGEEESLRAVGRAMNVQPERIRQIEAKALSKLRHPLTGVV
jgi:RNA polymerase sigma factor (sigma-70 family)